MGTLRHNTVHDVWFYSLLGGREAYETAPTSALLLLGLQASRLVWRRHHPGVHAAWRAIADVARGRRPFLTNDELFALIDGLPKDRTDRISVVRRALSATWDWHERWANKPLGDGLARAVEDVVSRAAMFLRDDKARLQRLHQHEARTLIHAWTGTIDAIPSDVLRLVLRQPTREAAEEAARSSITLGMWHPSRAAPGRTPFPDWSTSPDALDGERRRQEYAEQLAAAAEVERARRALLTPEERDAEDAEVAAMRMSLHGLIARDVQ